MKKIRLALIIILLLGFSGLVSPLAVLMATEIQITTNSSDQMNPVIAGNLIVWQDYRHGNADIYMYDLIMERETRITTDPAYQGYPAISGNRIVWNDTRNGYDIYMYDLSTQEEVRITTDPFSQVLPAISGDIVVWSDNRHEDWDIYMYDLTVGTETRITNGTAVYWNRPSISGNRIVWLDNRDGNYDIYMYDVSTQTESYLITCNIHTMGLRISGNIVVYNDIRNGNNDVYMYDLVTGTETQITTQPGPQEASSLSGDRIVWHDERNYIDDIYMYDLSTQEEVRITTDPSAPMCPDISGDRIVWQDYRNGNWDIYMYIFQPDIEITPIIHNFCDVGLGTTNTATIDVTNTGDADLMITDLNLVGKDFSLLLFPAPSEQIPPNSSREISIAFTPSLVGNATATLEINSNDPDEPQVQVPITGTGVEVEPLLCSEPLASHIYNGCTIPEDDPAGAWQIWEEYTYNSAWESEGGNLHLDACEQHGRAGFYRAEASLATAKKFAIEARAWLTCHVTPTLIELIYLGFTARDGVKAATLWTTGAPEEGQVALNWIDSTPYLSAKHVTDWYSPNIYRLVVDKTAANPAEHSAKVYVNGALVLTVPYDNLTDTPGGISDPPGVSHFFAFGGDQSDVVWDYVRYEECAQIPPEEQFEALIDEIEELLDSGEINEQDAKRLIAKLEDAVRKLSEGDVDTAIDQLNAFINKVQSLINSGQIDEEIGQQLIAAAQALIDQLNELAKAALAGDKADEPVPTAFSLEQNYPNPFNPDTEIRFQLPQASHVNLAVFNTLGQKIRTLADQNYQPGSHSARWDGRDENGTPVGSGVYFYQLRAGSTLLVKKMSLIL